MKAIDLIKKLEGLQTVESIQKKLSISRATAVKYIHILRKSGFVETSGGGSQPRFYRIGLKPKKEGNPGLYQMINKYSAVKLVQGQDRIIGRKLSIEEALVRAIETGEFRTILASLAFFNHIKSWSRLYRLAKEKNIGKKTGALYDTARAVIKARKMDQRIYNRLLEAEEKDKYIVDRLSSEDFKEIEKKWKIKIPFNKADLWRYKE